jgi:ABC-type lipoprotein release transport system permease subunit
MKIKSTDQGVFSMASSIPVLTQTNGLSSLRAIVRLAHGHFRRRWRFLLVTWLAILAMVMLACSPPLFSRVTISADLRAALANSSDGQNFIVEVNSLYPTNAQVQQTEQQLDHLFRQGELAAYLHTAPQLIVQTPPLILPSSGGRNSTSIVLDGYDPVRVPQHATVTQGRLPRDTTEGTVEIAITQSLARSQGLHVGSRIHSNASGISGLQTWILHVVGIVEPHSSHDSYWLVNPFGTLTSSQNGASALSVLAARETVRAKIAALQTPPGRDTSHLFWSYPFDVTYLDVSMIPAISQQTSDLPFRISNTLGQIPGVVFAQPEGSLFATLSTFSQQIVVLQIVTACLLLLILAILLLLVGMMSDMLVERQARIIAILRSRGATQQQIFGAFVLQGLAIGLAALLAGPLLAIMVVRAITLALLLPADQSALNVITANPISAALDVRWFAIAAVAVALIVMVVAINRAAKLDIVTLRRESSRSRRIPAWRRLNLDLLAVVLIVSGYIAYSTLWQTFITSQSGDPAIYNLVNIVGFIVPPLLVAALLLFVLRCFPWIARQATALVAKRRSAPAMLALVQVQRAPRPAARIVVLLALSIASSCFLLTLMSTNQERTSDAATFAVGADFSGPLPTSDASKTLNALKTAYSTLPGVQSATLGYSGVVSNTQGDIHIFAVDADTYASTALWPPQDSAQPLPSLAAKLAGGRSAATTHNVVYALVDSALWQQYELSPGASFTLFMNESNTVRVTFIALAEINFIPSTYDTPANPESDISLIVDYQSYATVYNKQSSMALSPNNVWLRTSDDPSQLAHIRSILPGLQDRRMLAESNRQSSAHMGIIGELAIGLGVALLLALIGTLLSSWDDASSRLTSFALMRALGMDPRQVAALLLWGQGFAYLLAFLLGIGLGTLLIVFVPSAVTLLDLTGPSAMNNPYDIPPLQIVIPYPQIALLLGGLVVVCLAALLLMAGVISRPSLGRRLRLDED